MHLAVIQALLLIAYMFHATESWDDRGLGVYSILAVGLFLGLKRFRHFLFIALSLPILYQYFIKFPNLANHSNLSFFLFLLIVPTSLYALKNSQFGSNTAMLRTLRLFAFITYFFAAFHKLNVDFFNPEFSCANDKMGEYLDLLPEFLNFTKAYLYRLLPLVGFFTEAIVPLCLFIPRLRYFGVIFQCALHFVLAPLGFIDFSSLALVFTWSFVAVPTTSVRQFDDEVEKQLRTIGLFSMALVIGLGIFRWAPQNEEYSFFEGMAFIAIFLPFIYNVILPRIDFSPMALPRSFILKMAVLLFFIYGFSNYLGLRTAGTFSMFSNIQTEGKTSNHLLLSANPFKIFSFQEDLIEIVSVSDNVQGFYRKMPVPGQLIPRVEFSRILDVMRIEERKNAALEVIYAGQTLKTEDATYDEAFYLSAPAWQKKLFKFRAVRKDGPQICAW